MAGESASCDDDGDDDLSQHVANVCGSSWQDAYAALHAEAVGNAAAASGRAPRILVFDTMGQGGLADRLTGLMTALLVAILTDRAIALDWPGHEEALRTPRFVGGANDRLLMNAKQARPADVRRLEWINKSRKQLQELVTSQPLDALWPERVILMRSNRGFTQGLLTAPQLAGAVASRQLTARNAQFGCLFNFLLRPTEAALQTVSPLLETMRAKDTVTVGVHVRTGDSAFDDEAAADDEAMRARGERLFASHKFIFEFATKLADELARAHDPPRAARLLLLGDSNALRSHAARVYGTRLLQSNASVGHVARQRGALLAAVGEHWLYTSSRAFAYSSHSGFPRTAAARALRDDAIHTCFHYTGPLYNAQPTARECTGPYSVAELGERHAAGL